MENTENIIESLSPLEIKILPFLHLKIEEIKEKSGLDETSVLRALRFLENKNLVKLKIERKEIVELGINGIYYRKNSLPERKLLLFLENNNRIIIDEAKKKCKLSDNEFNIALGVLKKKAIINIANGKLSIVAAKEELSKKFFEEKLLEQLPAEKSKLAPEELFALENLKARKEIIEIKGKTVPSFELTELGKKIDIHKAKLDLIEDVTPEIIKEWKNDKKFRKYDLKSPVPKIYGGKKHFVNQAIEHARNIWTEMGFKEMTGPITNTSFWNFDALFTPQDHPVREMQDTFFINELKGKLPEKKLVESVKKAHESGVAGSKGWNYSWSEEEGKKVILRTHTTILSAHTLSNLKDSDIPGKFFAIGKCFRNETLDWSHGFEFNQTEGIVIDKNANFRNLLGYLKEFFTKMGFTDVKFVPSYFPYTEPSVEIYGYLKEKGRWIEIGGAGIFRPEVVIPLLGKYIPVLAWGPGFDRVLMDYYKIKDLRELYSNDIRQLREKKAWIK